MHKQRSGCPLRGSTGGGVHLTMQLYGKGEGTGGGLFGQMNVYGRQEGREGLGLHGERMKRSALHVYGRFIG